MAMLAVIQLQLWRLWPTTLPSSCVSGLWWCWVHASLVCWAPTAPH